MRLPCHLGEDHNVKNIHVEADQVTPNGHFVSVHYYCYMVDSGDNPNKFDRDTTHARFLVIAITTP